MSMSQKSSGFPWNLPTHHWTHIEEYAGIALLLKHGEVAGLHGIARASVSLVDAGSPVPDHLVGRNWERERIAPIGVWGSWGPFDEHPARDKPRNHEKSAASLVLKFLKDRIPGFNDPRAEALVIYVTDIDQNAGATKYSLTNIVKNMNWLGDEKKTLAWVLRGIAAFLERGDPGHPSFGLEDIGRLIDDPTEWLIAGHEAAEWEHTMFQEAIDDIKGKGADLREVHFTTRNGHKQTIIAASSGNPMMARVLLTYRRAGVGIVRKPSGHVAILTSIKIPTDLTGLARTLNLMELEIRKDVRSGTYRFGELSPEGSVAGSVWSFQRSHRNQSLLNGSPSAPSVHPTQIPFEKIVELAALALDERRFCTEAEGHACNGTACDSKRSAPCPFFRFGLPRCQDLRQTEKYSNGNGRREPDPRFAKLAELRDQAATA